MILFPYFLNNLAVSKFQTLHIHFKTGNLCSCFDTANSWHPRVCSLYAMLYLNYSPFLENSTELCNFICNINYISVVYYLSHIWLHVFEQHYEKVHKSYSVTSLNCLWKAQFCWLFRCTILISLAKEIILQNMRFPNPAVQIITQMKHPMLNTFTPTSD
jgi:hypothetical protein